MWQAESRWSYRKGGLTAQKERWDRRAEQFDKGVRRVMNGGVRDRHDYVSIMLDRIEVKPGWTVLDIGSGPGTLAIPLAKKARSVTALDISPEMLKRLAANAAKSGLTNIKYLNSSWQDAFAGGLVEKHDVVVASRSLMAGDVREALAGIVATAGRAAYLTFPIVHLPFDWEVYEAIGRGKKKPPPYIYIYNMLYQMGVMANVEILQARVRSRFATVEEAIESLQWRTDPFTPEEMARLREFLEHKFAGQKGTAGFTHEGKAQWALIWWRGENRAIGESGL